MTRKKILPKAPVWSLTLQIRRQTGKVVWTGQGHWESNVLSKPCGFSCFVTSLSYCRYFVHWSTHWYCWFCSKIQENAFACIHHIQLLFSLTEEHLSWEIEFCIHDNIIQAGEVLVIHSDTIITVQKEKLPFKKVHIFCKRLNYDPSSV